MPYKEEFKRVIISDGVHLNKNEGGDGFKISSQTRFLNDESGPSGNSRLSKQPESRPSYQKRRELRDEILTLEMGGEDLIFSESEAAK